MLRKLEDNHRHGLCLNQLRPIICALLLPKKNAPLSQSHSLYELRFQSPDKIGEEVCICKRYPAKEGGRGEKGRRKGKAEGREGKKKRKGGGEREERREGGKGEAGIEEDKRWKGRGEERRGEKEEGGEKGKVAERWERE